MAPPGRRRFGALSTLPLASLALLLFASTASAASAVLGIDLGNEYIKAALIKPGIPLDIVLARDSKRKEAVAVAFKPISSVKNAKVAEGEYPERLYGSDALALTARRPDDVYTNLKQLLGLSIDSTIAEEYKGRYPALAIQSVDGRDTVGFSSPSFSKLDTPFSVEEILAMELQNVRQNAQDMAGKGLRVDNVVFTIPPFFTADERRALEHASELAGLKILGMVTDGLAVGINYATTRTFPSINEADKQGVKGQPELHMVFDMGAGSTTATVLKMQGRTVKDVGRFNKTITEVINLGSAWDKSLGGDSLNALILQDMIDKFVDSSAAKSAGVEAKKVKAHGRATAKLWKEAERLRQVLSANQQASTSFEGLYEDIDFRYKLERSAFEEMASDYVRRMETPFKQALEAAKVDFTDLNSVILHGGAVRTPIVQKQLEALTGSDSSKLKSNVNADEAAVFGAAFKAAGLSPSFRVKEIRDTDIGSYPAGIKYTIDGKEKSQKLFVLTSVIGAAKQVTMPSKADFDFTLFQIANAAEKDVVSVSTTNLTDSAKQLVDKFGCTKDGITTKFNIRLSPVNGLPEAVGGTVSCEVEDNKKGSIADNVKGLFGFGKKEKGSQEVLSEDEEESEVATDSSTPGASSSIGVDDGKPTSSASAEMEPATPKMRTETIAVAFTSTPRGLTPPTGKVLKEIKDRLNAFEKSDAARIERSDLLNSLEALTYRVRDWLEDSTFTGYASSEEQSSLKQLSQDASEWIYGEGADSTADKLREKLKGLNDIINPIKKRKDEAGKLPEQLKLLQDALNYTGSMIGNVRTSLAEQAAKAEEGEAAASSVSEGLSSAGSGASESASSAVEGEDESSTSTASSKRASPTAFLPEWTPEDLTTMSKLYEDTKEWLEEKLALQEKRGDAEDAAMTSSELAAKAKALNQEVTYMLQKRLNAMNKPKAKSKTKSSKSKKEQKTSKVDDNASTAEAPEPSAEHEPEPSGQKSAEAEATPSVMDDDRPSEKDVPPHGEL